MSWLSSTIKKFGNSIVKRAPQILTGGLIGGPVTGALMDGVSGLTGSDSGAGFAAQADQYYDNAIDYNANAINISQERRDAMSGELDNLRNRAETIYDPMERALAAEVSGPADLEGAAATARNEFTTNFDQSTSDAEQRLLQMGVRPNASTYGQMQGTSAYDRARGATEVANQARTAEDDQHFLRQSTFYAQNGSGIREELRAGMSDMYGADYNAQQNAATFSTALGDRYQGYSDQQNAQAGAGLSSLMSLGGTIAGTIFGGPAGAAVGSQIGGAVGGAMNKSQPSAQGAHGTAASSVPYY